MRKPASLLALLTLAVAAATTSCASINGPRGGRIFLPAANPNAPAQLERIKSLEGAWQWAPELGPELGGLVAIYHVTAAGNAVIETLFPGDPFEMVTLYHLDGEQLILTNYSSAGNQPTMRAEAGKPDSDSIHFNYIGATNLHSVNDTHMHAMSFIKIAPNELLTSWSFYTDQKPTGDKVFKLVRYWAPVEPEAPAEDPPSTFLDDLATELPVEAPSSSLAQPAEIVPETADESPADAEAELAELEAELEADLAAEEAEDAAPVEEAAPTEDPKPIEPASSESTPD